MPRAGIRPAFLLNREFHPVSPKVILFILFAIFAKPHSTHSVFRVCQNHKTMSCVTARKRQRLDIAAAPS